MNVDLAMDKIRPGLCAASLELRKQLQSAGLPEADAIGLAASMLAEQLNATRKLLATGKRQGQEHRQAKLFA